jgi:hypothetical protein
VVSGGIADVLQGTTTERSAISLLQRLCAVDRVIPAFIYHFQSEQDVLRIVIILMTTAQLVTTASNMRLPTAALQKPWSYVLIEVEDAIVMLDK